MCVCGSTYNNILLYIKMFNKKSSSEKELQNSIKQEITENNKKENI